MKKYTKGFTLIELLVVIAIIGILASVVLVSLNSARKKGNDTRVISDVQQIRTALESGFAAGSYPDLGTNTFSNAGPDWTNINQLLADANNQGAAGQIGVVSNSTTYAIYGKLVSNGSLYFCIDSNGKTNPAANAANTFACP